MTAPDTSTPSAAVVGSAPWSCILFDLDGTITDSAPGITAQLAKTLLFMGLPVPGPAQLLEYVGPPILDSFRDLAGMDDVAQQRALAHYREGYAGGGVFDSSVYAGVPEVLRAIHAVGIPISLATSKPESQARRVLDHYGLADLFTEVCGASEDEVRSAKADVIEEALRRLRADGIDLGNVVMVGDREHDVLGAAAHGIPTVMVGWGYGSPAEAAGTIAVVETAAELEARLLPTAARPTA
ncbi:HAD family hydrolase [Clavibacter michiganensis]|uniref:HAD family hydrolase n=1 Tax=Clavibacter michiganensis TaxID=28447 RepID=UPI001D0BAC75|nr:HAD family hydrolase [Clavibacter michiganensis]MDO4044047.1 HAD family hydrolase [Clavibacter michiganensis]MDO4052417.1 HAD family hydrolase [Clavibacter michiganensis]MDO4056164.1 HAD family hydrolase [Clavibacter michiganensis]MDO4068572.1 HAD family hydrolase [Clavibacter michiganensis]UDM13667.1 HAD family hydrolase [Clavibacter michiganensis subsp. michiganensis]